MTSLSVHSGHDMVAINKFPRHTPEIFPRFHSVAISFKNVCNSAFFLQSTPCALQRVASPLAQSGGIDSLVA